MAEIVKFDPKGGPIHADVHCGFAQDGAYVLTLWSGNSIVQRWEGNFLNPDDDSFQMPGTPAEQAGRLLQCRAEIGIVPPITKYAILMTVWQDDKKLATLAQTGEESKDVLVGVNLFARIEAAS